jgi:NADH-quinone oxidoreductase subunit N
MDNLAANIQIMLPELYLCAMAIFLLMVTAFKCKRADNAMIGGTLFTLAGTAWFLWPQLQASGGEAWNGFFVTSGFIVFAKLLVLAAAFLVTLISSGWLKEEGGRPSEFLVLTLFSTLGMLLMLSAGDLLTLYMGLELSSLSLYVLASFERDHPKSSEAGLKYFVLGALASGMMLFGMSLVYGFAGTTGFDALGQHFSGLNESVSRGVVVGVILIVIGFCFKLSAVPFHMWAPDVYEGSPTPVTAFFATAPKIAALALFTRLMLQPFGPLMAQWQQIIIFVAVASMLVGALAAIMQTNIKRLLAYSSIGHVGFMLVGLAAGNQGGVQAMLIYLAIYIFMSAGAFGCVLMMRRQGQAVEDIKELSGLAQTHPAMAMAVAIFMFSLAGIPPLAGFFGKMYVVLAAIQGGLAWLAVVAVATSVIGCYYYLKVVKVMYFDTPLPAFDKAAPLGLRIGVGIGAAMTLLFVLMPTPLVAQAMRAAEILLQ